MSRTRILTTLGAMVALAVASVGVATPAHAATSPRGIVSVQLVDVNGVPLHLPGFTVGSYAFGGTIEESLTDASGHATLEGVKTGGYEISANNEAAQPQVYAPAERDGVVVKANTTTSVTVTMAHGATVTGRIVGPDGSALPHTTVFIRGQAEVTQDVPVATDSTGRYTFSGLQSDAYELSSSITGGPATAAWVTRVYQERPGREPSHVTLSTRTVHTSSDLALKITEAPDPASLIGATVRLTNISTGATHEQSTSGALGVQQSMDFDVPSGSYTLQVRTIATATTPEQVWWSCGGTTTMTLDPTLALPETLHYSSQTGLFLRFPAS